MSQPHRLGDASPGRVAVVRALRGLGDILCAVPAWRALRAALPNAHIALVGLPAVAGLIERFGHYLDALLEFPGFPGIPERAAAVGDLPAFLTGVQRQSFDLAIQMHGSGIISNAFTVLLGARVNAGFYLPGQYCPDPERFLPYPSDEPEVRRHLRLMAFLGMPPAGEELEFPLRAEDWASLAAIPAARRLARGSYACIHPGASEAARRWAPQHFAAVGDDLGRQGLQVVLTGSAAEAPLTAAVKAAMQHPALDLAGQTGLGALAALLASARLLVCNDTGVSHLAAALHTPSVIIFVDSDPRRWAPLDQARHRRVGRPVYRDHRPGCACPTGDRCLREGCLMTASLPAPATPRQALLEARSLLLLAAPAERRRVA